MGDVLHRNSIVAIIVQQGDEFRFTIHYTPTSGAAKAVARALMHPASRNFRARARGRRAVAPAPPPWAHQNRPCW